VARHVDAPLVQTGSTASAVLYRYFDDLPATGYEWAYGDHSAAGFIPTNDATCVFVATTPARLRRLRRAGAERAFAELIGSAAPSFVDRLADASPTSRMHGWGGEPGYLRQSWGPGWALVGDAGYFKDPITTHGMTDALRDAELFAESVLAGPSRFDEAAAAYQRTRDRLSYDMINVTEAVAGYDWNLDRLRRLLREVSAAMGGEVDHLQSLPLTRAWRRGRSEMRRSSNSGDRVATDPDVVPKLADMDATSPSQHGSLPGYVGAGRPTGRNQPLANGGIEAAGDRVLN
jgi:2-polyprenyl-6-methoxyphenol hydroxylase-like FAD-dependent oxidoreductase